MKECMCARIKKKKMHKREKSEMTKKDARREDRSGA